MKNIVVISFILFLFSCNSIETQPKYYIESKPSFYDLQNGSWITNKWIRKSENLAMIHETFKKFGYEFIILGVLNQNPFILQGIYINKRGYDLLDSLELTYNQGWLGDKYYREFWQRRKTEKNDSMVYQIIKDIKYSFKTKTSSSFLSMTAIPDLINDTLLNLLQIEYEIDSLTEENAYRNFETLKRLGFHQSAYNLLYERGAYEKINWNRDSLEKTLTPTDTFVGAWFQDNTK